MYIEVNISSYEELEAITIILLNKIIKEAKGGIALDDVGVSKVICKLDKELTEKEHFGNLYSVTSPGYGRSDILICAMSLLERQRNIRI